MRTIWLTTCALVAAATAFLAAQAGNQTPPPQSTTGCRSGRGGVGPDDKPAVDAAAAARGRTVWAAECITCHGTQARGTDTGPNLVRSVLVLHDRCGSELGPFLKRGHQTQSGTPSGNIPAAGVVDLAHFLRERIDDTLRSSPLFDVQNILTGDAKAGATYFAGDGGCTKCHSVTGNLAGIGSRLTPVNIQQRVLFPTPARGRGAGRGAGGEPAPNPYAITVSVTPANGQPASGVLVQMDDFTVTMRDQTGDVRTFRRTPAMKVVTTDPLQAHRDLLNRITDRNLHDLVAYLETVK